MFVENVFFFFFLQFLFLLHKQKKQATVNAGLYKSYVEDQLGFMLWSDIWPQAASLWADTCV